MTTLPSVTFECEVITPMFLGGADPNKPELRPPSIRGAMRWWFRAMTGGLLGENRTENLLKLESLVFGDTNRASAITVRILDAQCSTMPRPRLPHKSGDMRAMREAIDVGGTSQIQLGSRNGNSNLASETFDVAKQSLILVLGLGGLGTRSRRGFGSFWSDNDSSEKEIILSAQRVFEEFLVKNGINSGSWTTTPSFPCVARDYFELWTANATGAWEPELTRLMNLMHTISQTKHSNGLGGIIRHSTHRLASPLIVHAKKVANQVQLLFCHFRTNPSGQIRIFPIDYDAIETAIQSTFGATKVGVFS